MTSFCAQLILSLFWGINLLFYHHLTQEERHTRYGCGPTLTSWVQEQQRRIPGKTLSLVIINMEKYFRYEENKEICTFNILKRKDLVNNEFTHKYFGCCASMVIVGPGADPIIFLYM